VYIYPNSYENTYPYTNPVVTINELVLRNKNITSHKAAGDIFYGIIPPSYKKRRCNEKY